MSAKCLDMKLAGLKKKRKGAICYNWFKVSAMQMDVGVK